MLRVEGVAKRYLPPRGALRAIVRSAAKEPVDALRGVDLSAGPGEVVGLVGPNGAGKTTLIKIIATLLDADGGTVTLDGLDTRADPLEARRRTGLVLAEERAMYWRLTGHQNLEFFGVMQGLSRPLARARASELLEQFELADRDKLVFGYSSGMRARLALARALLNRPPLLVLDEPTRGLDPVATGAVAGLLRRAAADGAAVLLSSHRLDEVEEVCNRVVAVVDGQVRFDGTVEELSGGGRFAGNLRALLGGGGEPG